MFVTMVVLVSIVAISDENAEREAEHSQILARKMREALPQEEPNPIRDGIHQI